MWLTQITQSLSEAKLQPDHRNMLVFPNYLFETVNLKGKSLWSGWNCVCVFFVWFKSFLIAFRTYFQFDTLLFAYRVGFCFYPAWNRFVNMINSLTSKPILFFTEAGLQINIFGRWIFSHVIQSCCTARYQQRNSPCVHFINA